MECGKKTMNFELGDVFYRLDDKNSTESENDVLVKDPVVCPKCKKDISDGKCEVNSTYFHLALITADICRIGQLKGQEIETPPHLRGGYSLIPADFEKMKPVCRSKLILV